MAHKCEGAILFAKLGDYPDCQSTVTRPFHHHMLELVTDSQVVFWLCDLHFREAMRRFEGVDVLQRGYGDAEIEW